MIEELLEFFVGEIDANLLESIVVKNFKPGNVEDTDEELAFLLGVEGLVDAFDKPEEEFVEL